MKLTIKMKAKGSADEMRSMHPGFQKVAQMIAQKSGVPQQNANAMLAGRTRNASPAAKKKNPKLLNVK